MPSDNRVIKKYENRKLYDVQDRKYVNMSDLIKLVELDDKFSIIDNKTKDDLTNWYLGQMVLSMVDKLPTDKLRFVARNLCEETRNAR